MSLVIRMSIPSLLFWILLLVMVNPFSLNSQESCLNFSTIGEGQIELTVPNYYYIETFGSNIVNLGDLDGDGIDDLGVGTPDQGACVNNTSTGFCNNIGSLTIIFMNQDGSVKNHQNISQGIGGFTEYLDFQSDFGGDVINLGDLNGDQIDDLLVANSNLSTTSAGSAGGVHVLFMNSDGTVASSVTTDANDLPIIGGQIFADAVLAIEDIDGDGIPEFLTSDRFDNAYLVSINSDGTLKNLSLITPSGMNSSINDFTDLGDIDGDGINDVVLSTDENQVIIWLMNANGTVKSQQIITDSGLLTLANFNTVQVESVGDIDGDGNTDIIVGDPSYDLPISNAGAIHIVSLNADGSIKSTKTLDTSYFPEGTIGAGDRFGADILYQGDIDSDGFENILVGTQENFIMALDIMCVNGEIILQDQCPTEIINTIAADATEVCANDNLPNISNSEFDIILGSGALDNGVDIGLFTWEVSYDGGTNWEVVPGVTTQDFTGDLMITDETQIRRVYEYSCCLSAPVYSNVLSITVQGESPEVSVTPLFYCPLTGGSASFEVAVTGGTGPFTYSWSPTAGLDDPTAETPTVTFGSSDVYELTVTGADGCAAMGSGILFPIQADAGGTFTYVCEPGGVSIGMSALPTSDPITYSWSPTNGLSCTDCPDPVANPGTTTTYTLTVDDGNGCITTSSIEVDPDAFIADAGTDIYVCQGTDVVIGGATSQSGIFYGWAPGLYIDNQLIAQPTFFSGVAPDPNPYVYTLTTFDEANGGCYSVDSLLAHVTWADAGAEDTVTVCGEPIQIGTPDCCDGQATYEWTVLSGDANSFVDPVTGLLTNTSNIPQPSVLPTTQCTEYQVTVTWGPNADNSGGAVCTDSRVICPVCEDADGCPVIDVGFDNEVACGVGTMGTILTVPLNPDFWTFDWTPSTNLSCTDCPNPMLTADITSDITYTMTYTSTVDPTISCFFQVDMFDSATATPTPLAQGGFKCQSTDLQIGAPPVVGWSYNWSPTSNLSDATSSNPSTSTAFSRNYTLTVTDDVTGCSADTSIRVAVFESADFVSFFDQVCSGDPISIGQPAIDGVSYSWSPTTGLDDPNSANPTAIVTGTDPVTYTVTATGFGCTATESITITPTPQIPVTPPSTIYLCEGSQAALILEIGSSFNGFSDVNVNWSPATGLSATSGNPVVVSGLTSTTTYTATVTSANGNCPTIVNVTVEVVPPPTATLPDISICGEETITLGPASADPAVWYQWDSSPNLEGSIFSSNPTATVSEPTSFTVTITNSTTNCFREVTQNVVWEGAVANAGGDVTLCENNSVTIGSPAEAGASYSWTPSLFLDDPNIAQPTATPEANITYVLSTELNGCTDTDTISLFVTPGVEFSLAPFAVVCSGQCTMIGVTENSEYTYQWFPADGVASPTSAMTEVCPTTNTIRSLTVTNPATGCSETQTISILTEACPATYDVALEKSVDTAMAAIGSDVVFTITVENLGDPVTGANVNDVLPTGLIYSGVYTASTGTYDGTNWVIGSMAAGATETIQITATVDAEGVLTNEAVVSINETETNLINNEDEACVSVPIQVCDNETIDVDLFGETGLGMYQWYKDGVAIAGATTDTYKATEPGTYTYTTDGAGPTGDCVAELCCPVVIEQISCCAPRLCLPVTITKLN